MNNDTRDVTSNGHGPDGLGHIRNDRYQKSIQELTAREAEFNRRLEARQRSANELRERHLVLLDTKEKEYAAERMQVKGQLRDARLNLEAAHRSAGEHCSEVPVQYIPGKTTEADVLAVPPLEEAEAAHILGLPFGPGFSDRLIHFLKPLLTLLCWLMSSLSLGLAFRLLDARNIFAKPAMVGLFLVMGGVVAMGLLLAVTPPWKSIGTKVGSRRPTREVIALLVPFSVMTVGFLAGLAFLDATAIIRLNAALAALNPAFAIPMAVALLVGLVISGVYVLGLAGTAFAEGYTAAARKSIYALIKREENDKRDQLKMRIPIREALEALADVKVAEEIVRRLENELQVLEQQAKTDRAELLASIPEVPTAPEPEEVREIGNLRDRARSESVHRDAHIASRGGRTGNGNTNNGNTTE